METYIDDNTTLLSDAGYQQQSFSVQQDPTNGYDMGHAAAFGQGQGKPIILFHHIPLHSRLRHQDNKLTS